MSHTPRKRFGQNFLRDPMVVERIVAALAIRPEDHLVEIGPGEGAMTARLLASGARLDAVEIDRDLIEPLRARWGSLPGFQLHEADALKFDYARLGSPGSRLRLIGNLPYNISTPLLFHLFEHAERVEDMHFMLQKEVVDRLCAAPGESGYGRLGIMAAYHVQAIKLFEVAPESFHPRPKVVSAIVRLIPHRQKPVEADRGRLGRVVTTAFSQRRKTLRNSLRSLFDETELSALGVDPDARAETLSLAQYARLSLHLAEREG